MMTKAQFTEKYSRLTTAEKAEITAHYNGILRGAMFAETFTEAEQRLLWIREIEHK